MIQINGPGIDDTESLLTILPQKINEPLDRYKVRQSVQALYNTGRFAEIQVEASAIQPEKWYWRSMPAKIISLAPFWRKDRPLTRADNQLVNASKLNLGEQYTDEKITAGIEGMQRTLQENGYYQATIKPYYEWDSRNQQVKVQFMVARGKPARIGMINVGGSPGYSAEEVRKITKLRSGDKVTAAIGREHCSGYESVSRKKTYWKPRSL